MSVLKHADVESNRHNLIYNSNITIACHEGYMLNGSQRQMTVTCGENGTWIPAFDDCQRRLWAWFHSRLGILWSKPKTVDMKTASLGPQIWGHTFPNFIKYGENHLCVRNLGRNVVDCQRRDRPHLEYIQADYKWYVGSNSLGKWDYLDKMHSKHTFLFNIFYSSDFKQCVKLLIMTRGPFN